jgi:hypothetical protein
MSKYLPRRSALPAHKIVSKGSSEALKVDIRDIERDLKLLAAHKDVLVFQANRELKNALSRVYCRATSLQGTASYKDFYETIRDSFPNSFDPKIGSIGAIFRGYEFYEGDLPSRFLAPTVIDSILPPGVRKENPPKHTIMTISRIHPMSSNIIINRKGDETAYIFTTDNTIETLSKNEIEMIKTEGVSRYRIVHYVDGKYSARTDEFLPVETKISAKKPHKSTVSADGIVLFLFLVFAVLSVTIFFMRIRQ